MKSKRLCHLAFGHSREIAHTLICQLCVWNFDNMLVTPYQSIQSYSAQ
jgi:hypothetical protein